MACCGSSSKSRTITKQVVQRPNKAKKSVTVQRIGRNNSVSKQQRNMTTQRQRLVPRQKCECGYPTMAVNIAGRERLQCSNPNCRKIIK